MMNLEQFQWDDVPWVAHQALDDDRDRINLMRLIAFQMPEIRKAFPVANYPIDPSTPIVIRTQHYLGQPEHPASRKAVLSVKVEDLERLKKLTSAQSVHKFKLLAGPRYDPDRGSIKISSDSFPDPSMNAKWCSDALDRLIAEAQDLTDSMQDIPLDLRHAEVRKLKKGKRRATIKDFPVDWLPPKATE
ncbi:37S ribosomal protein S24, mitochondrial [Cystobasidiomycetes sp. EMM_F5]